MSEQNEVTTAPTIIGSTDKSVEWYDKNFKGTNPDARTLLETYSRIPPEKVDEYVLETRDKAWAIFPYPCIGQFRFLTLSLREQPSYAAMLERIQGGAKYLDIGCCVGQDIRQLVSDGAPSGNLYGAELEANFIDLGYDFFRDRETLKTHFVQADILKLDEAGSPLAPLVGTFEFIHLGMVLHIFDWDTQRIVLENCVKLLKPEVGVLILGRAIGDLEGTTGGDKWDGRSFRHSDGTFNKIWREVEERTGVKFDCRASMDGGIGVDEGNRLWDLKTSRRLQFEVERLG